MFWISNNNNVNNLVFKNYANEHCVSSHATPQLQSFSPKPATVPNDFACFVHVARLVAKALFIYTNMVFNQSLINHKHLEPLKRNVRLDECGRRLSFHCHWILNLIERDEIRSVTETLTFTTSFTTAAYDWVAHLCFRHRNATRAINEHQCLELYVEHGRQPMFDLKPSSMRMAYNIYADAQMSKLMYSQPYKQCFSTPSVLGLVECYKAPEGEFCENLAQWLGNRLRTAYRFVVSIEMNFDRDDFFRCVESFSDTLQSVPVDVVNDFRFAHKRNPDFKIVCRDGEVPASRFALFLSTEYFRAEFNNEERGGVHQNFHYLQQFGVRAMRLTIDYLHSNTIEHDPYQWSFVDADELMQILVLFRPLRKDELRIFAHQMLIEALKQVAKTNLDQVVRILLLANEYCFSQLKVMCYATICNMHYNNFKDRFRPDANDEADRATYEQLHQSRAFTFQSPLLYVDRMRMKIARCELMFGD